ncbi:BatD family protein [Leeuwenhoekiella sp. A16]|uniref:BatD family protein n=1 Tax=unclassified Leeuwenhoekiella TaxID=2615029 RepID=UPI003A803C19
MKMKLGFLLVLIFTGFTTWAQVTFDATVSKKKLGINERLRVDFEMNKDGDNFQPPSFQGFNIVGGPNQSVSRQWVNGKSSFSKVFSYFLAPRTTGEMTIGQAEITIDGDTYKTVPITVQVTTAVDKPKDGNNAEYVASENVHLVAEVSKSNPYLNEAITVVYKLYVSRETAVSGWNEIDAPKFADFWSQSIDEKQFKVYDGEYNGEPYRYVILRRTVLYPQKTGELTIEPLALNINVDVPTERRDIFGQRISRPAQITVAANNRKITVKPLPENGKPADFSGAVGSFDFKVSADKTKLDASEALDLEIMAKGNGNLKLFKLPKPNLPNSLEVYEPQHNENVRTNLSGMGGSIADNYTVVPQTKGKYPIPSISFSYFNPKTERYQTITSDEILIEVENGPLTAQNSEKSSGVAKSNVIAKDQFKYISSDTELYPKDEEQFFASTTFWSLVGAPLLLIPLALFVAGKRRAYKNDVKGNRLRKADRLARKYLGEAKKNLGDQKVFYLSLEKSLHNYLKAKLNIQTSDMSKERIRGLLIKQGASESSTQEFISLLENCEFARYTPATSVEMQQDYEKASRVISEIDKQL